MDIYHIFGMNRILIKTAYLLILILGLPFSLYAKRFQPVIFFVETDSASYAELSHSTSFADFSAESYDFVYCYRTSYVDFVPDAPEGYRTKRVNSLSELGKSFSEQSVLWTVRTDDFDEFLRRVKEAGVYDNAMIILTTVGSEPLSPYEYSWHAPLMIKLPTFRKSTLPAGSTIDEPVMLYDLNATLVHLVERGNKPESENKSVDMMSQRSESLLPLIRRRAKAWRQYVFFNGEGFKAVTDGRFKYIVDESGNEYFYNLLVDSAESENIMPEKETILLKTMREALQSR